jgi:UDP-N-acetyl-D-galactosamine dehydrogenase
MVNADIPAKGARVGILGLTFKENCTDLRNSRVPDIFRELREFGIDALVHDPRASAAAARHEYGITLSSLHDFRALDALILAVCHDEYTAMGGEKLGAAVRDGGIVIDIKSALDPRTIGGTRRYWSL